MCKEHLIAQDVVSEFVNKHNDFQYKDLLTAIKNKGGILRVAPGYSIKDFITDLIEAGVIKYDYTQDKFIVTKDEQFAY